MNGPIMPCIHDYFMVSNSRVWDFDDQYTQVEMCRGCFSFMRFTYIRREKDNKSVWVRQ